MDTISWITNDDLFLPDHPYAEIAAAQASGILYNLTGEKFQGIRQSREVITKPEPLSGNYAPQLVSGKMYNLPTRGCSSQNLIDTSCMKREMWLRHGPVREVFSVYADGVEVDPESYSLRNKTYLVKRGRNGFWNFCGTHEFEVHYEYGALPPRAGIEAAIALGNEFLLKVDGDDRCRLPERVSSITRQGVSIRVGDSQEFFEQGRTGIYEVDLFIKAYNPSKAKKKARVFIPGRHRNERVD